MTTAAILDLIRSELLREVEQSLTSADQRQARNGSRRGRRTQRLVPTVVALT